MTLSTFPENSIAVDEIYFPPLLKDEAGSKVIMPLNAAVTINLEGSFFTPNMVATCDAIPDLTVTFIDDNHITLTGNSTAVINLYDLKLNNGFETTLTDFVELKVIPWIDLRAGGDTVTPRASNPANITRDADGLGLPGVTGWSRWVVLEEFQWPRSEKKTVTFVMKPVGAWMVGFFNQGWNETSNAQYLQLEHGFYFNSTTSFWGIYRKNGTANNTTSISGTTLIKCVVTSNGEQGSNYSLYDVSAGDWNSNSLPIIENEVINLNNNTGSPLIPAIVTNSGTCRLQALLIEDT